MDGVVTLLPEPVHSQVEAIWAELSAACGVQGINATPVPHFSWHVAERYHEDQLKEVLQELGVRSQPFQVRTAGLGVFSRELPIVYIALVKDARLLDFHKRLHRRLGRLAVGPNDYYHPENWMPHITLVFEDLGYDNLSCVMEKLVFRHFAWTFTVDNLSLIGQPPGKSGSVYFSIPFGAGK